MSKDDVEQILDKMDYEINDDDYFEFESGDVPILTLRNLKDNPSFLEKYNMSSKVKVIEFYYPSDADEC